MFDELVGSGKARRSTRTPGAHAGVGRSVSLTTAPVSAAAPETKSRRVSVFGGNNCFTFASIISPSPKITLGPIRRLMDRPPSTVKSCATSDVGRHSNCQVGMLIPNLMKSQEVWSPTPDLPGSAEEDRKPLI